VKLRSSHSYLLRDPLIRVVLRPSSPLLKRRQ
jgi:hypothetical protein